MLLEQQFLAEAAVRELEVACDCSSDSARGVMAEPMGADSPAGTRTAARMLCCSSSRAHHRPSGEL